MAARVALLALAVALVAPAGADAAVTRDRSGDVKARGLSAADRRALDIVRVDVRPSEPAGLLVSVTFRGNVERRIGRGRLRGAQVAMLLVPAEGRGSPAALLTSGAAPGVRVDNATRSRRFGTVWEGRRLTFFIAGTGASNVRRVAVRSYARPLRARASTGISGEKLRLMEKGMSAADALLGVAFGGLGTSCAELRENDQIVRARLRALSADRRRLTEAVRGTRKALAEGRADLERARDQRRRRVGGLREQPALEQRIEEVQDYIDRLALLERIGETALKRIATAERSLLAVEDAIGKALVGLCDPANQPTPAVEDFFGTWRHGTKKTYVCVLLRGEPGQYTEVAYSGGPKAPENGVVQRQRLDAAGRGVAKFLIDTQGPYRFTPQWEGDDGTLHFKPSNNAFDQVVTIDVKPPPTNGLPAPAEYAPATCPAP